MLPMHDKYNELNSMYNEMENYCPSDYMEKIGNIQRLTDSLHNKGLDILQRRAGQIAFFGSILQKCASRSGFPLGDKTDSNIEKTMKVLNTIAYGGIYNGIQNRSRSVLDRMRNNDFDCNELSDLESLILNVLNHLGILDGTFDETDNILGKLSKSLGMIGTLLNCGDNFSNLMGNNREIFNVYSPEIYNAIQSVEYAKSITPNNDNQEIFNESKMKLTANLDSDFELDNINNKIENSLKSILEV